jgi:hypothetical protein
MRLGDLMILTYFPEALDHCLRRQRELCAIGYWRATEDELMNRHTYEKIKREKEPQTYKV